MADLSNKAYINGKIVDVDDAKISIASSAVMYGLSIYSVFFAKLLEDNSMLAFRMQDHYKRLISSAKLIGLDDISSKYSFEEFEKIIKELKNKNNPTTDIFFRVTVHASEQVAGVKTKGLEMQMSIFMYEAVNILPQGGAKLKTSLWRRTSDYAIPARAKVNGAYVNSCLAKQEAISNGYDDCIFLNNQGFVSELSAANIFIVKDGNLITPDASSDILEGITRRSIIELAEKQSLQVVQRKVALTEVYTADEVFACGTSAFVSPILNVDERIIGDGKKGAITTRLRDQLVDIQQDTNSNWTTLL